MPAEQTVLKNILGSSGKLMPAEQAAPQNHHAPMRQDARTIDTIIVEFRETSSAEGQSASGSNAPSGDEMAANIPIKDLSKFLALKSKQKEETEHQIVSAIRLYDKFKLEKASSNEISGEHIECIRRMRKEIRELADNRDTLAREAFVATKRLLQSVADHPDNPEALANLPPVPVPKQPSGHRRGSTHEDGIRGTKDSFKQRALARVSGEAKGSLGPNSSIWREARVSPRESPREGSTNGGAIAMRVAAASAARGGGPREAARSDDEDEIAPKKVETAEEFKAKIARARAALTSQGSWSASSPL
uniref:Uncharacterized protein n=1 Tax=Hemiselmis andersenii TaxID=464988 RepID=A0A7S1E8Z9_HEMAN|mmetsp:Transcript_40669/g.98947  ORF Transcript_40669/g.98947 Transcript_40669/m.98947 type:complete len:304 (+) Transcript_40669:101-1012(+)